MKLLLITDAWAPQVNGVVVTITRTAEEMRKLGVECEVVHPGMFRAIPCPTYPEIPLAILPRAKMARIMDSAAPDAVHIATEGPLGIAARAECLRRGWRFTTAYHTRFPEYLRMRLPVPLAWSYAALRNFHGAAECTMATTETQRAILAARGFKNLVLWGRGVDSALFRPREKEFLEAPRPIFMYVGRVAPEKNLPAFLDLGLPGTKYVVGDGPARAALQAKHADARFTGFLHGETLARHLAAADVFVFPSLTDTFGLVMLEALACGVPVAAFPVAGPQDVIEPGLTGILDPDLGRAARAALKLDPAVCRARAGRQDWAAATRQFLSHVSAIRGAAHAPPFSPLAGVA